MYCTLQSELGDLRIEWDEDERVCAICLPGSGQEPGGSAEAPPAKVQKVVELLRDYLAGTRVRFPRSSIVLPGTTPFMRSVYNHVFEIAPGHTETYGQVATAVGKPGAARAVGNAMARNPLPLIVPCHRVLATDGLGGYASGLEHKRYLLALEGAASPA